MPESLPLNPSLGVELVGTGMALPSKQLTNDDLAGMVDTSDAWIVKRTGIKTRYVLAEDETLDALAAQAVTEALDRAGLQANHLDLLVCASTRPDMLCPALACRVVEKIGAIPCGAFDLNVACTGFVAALSVGAAMIKSGTARTVAIVGAEAFSKCIDWQDRKTCVLFGDGASCAILQASNDATEGCHYQSLHSDAVRGRSLYIPEEDAQIPPGAEEIFNGTYGTLQMDGRSVYKFAVEALANSVEDALQATSLTSADIAMVISHQSNIRMLQSAWSRLDIPLDKIHINIDRYGNTGAASVGLCLHECLRDGQLKPGDHVVFVAQGGGLSWGASIWRL